jgi:hypothetical protein
MLAKIYRNKTKQQQQQKIAGHQWLTPVILATQETEIRSINVQSQLEQIVHETLSQKYSNT